MSLIDIQSAASAGFVDALIAAPENELLGEQ
jgi:hypothetical protein